MIETFIQSVSLFLGCSQDSVKSLLPSSLFQAGITILGLNQTLDKSIELLQSVMKGKNIKVIANFTPGMGIVYGESNEELRTEKDCVLYLHNAMRPTIATYTDLGSSHFVLLRTASTASAKHETPYGTVQYPCYLDPYIQRSTPCHIGNTATRSKKQRKMRVFPQNSTRNASIPVLLEMTEEEKVYIPQLNFHALFSKSHRKYSCLDVPDPERRIMEVKNYKMLDDMIMDILLEGYVAIYFIFYISMALNHLIFLYLINTHRMVNESMNETNPETLVFCSLHCRNLMSAEYHVLNKFVSNYHRENVKNRKVGTVFQLEYIFLQFSFKTHWIPVIIFNPSLDPNKFQGEAG